MEIIRQAIESTLPENFDLSRYFLSLVIAIIGILIIGGIFRLCLGKGSVLNAAISSAIAILCLYIINVVIYSFGKNLSILFTPLPFVTVEGDYLNIFPIFDASLPAICSELINMIILSFLMNLLETWLPKGKKVLGWFCFRFLSLTLAICLHYCINIFLNSVMNETILALSPVILLGILLLAFLLGILKLLVGGALAFINPFLGLFHTFFFKNDIGKQLRRALVTTVILAFLVCVLNYFSYTSIYIASVAIITYLPAIIFALILWYVIAQFL